MNLAKEITRLYSDEEQSEAAEKHFIRVFKSKGIPDEMDTIEISGSELTDGEIWIADLITHAKFAPSKSEARRLVQQGAVRLNGVKVDTLNRIRLDEGSVLQVGKLKFGRISIQ
jgi:tyrosyl-tRNA synthetase